jgi:hypothetical protein
LGAASEQDSNTGVMDLALDRLLTAHDGWSMRPMILFVGSAALLPADLDAHEQHLRVNGEYADETITS